MDVLHPSRDDGHRQPQLDRRVAVLTAQRWRELFRTVPLAPSITALLRRTYGGTCPSLNHLKTRVCVDTETSVCCGCAAPQGEPCIAEDIAAAAREAEANEREAILARRAALYRDALDAYVNAFPLLADKALAIGTPVPTMLARTSGLTTA